MARAAVNITVDIIGLAELRKLMTGDDLYATAWRSGMTKLASQAGLAALGHAPVGGAKDPHAGRLQASIRTAVQNRPFPQWAVVRVNARAAKRYGYPRLLEFSPKHHHKEWLLKAVRQVWAGADLVLNEIGEKIARRWAA